MNNLLIFNNNLINYKQASNKESYLSLLKVHALRQLLISTLLSQTYTITKYIQMLVPLEDLYSLLLYHPATTVIKEVS